MPIDLGEAVSEYLGHVTGLRIACAVGTAWTNQTVDLEYKDLTIRVSVDRGAIEVYFGAVQDPLRGYNPSEVRALVGDRPASLASKDVDKTLGGLRELLEIRRDAVAHLFSPQVYQETKRRASLLARR
jgi:hypothetical protein